MSAKDSTICIRPSVHPRFKKAPREFREFMSSLRSYYNTDTLSDVIVTCEGQEFKVHKVILSAHSKYFSTELNGNWKESSEGKIEVKDFDSSVVDAMLRYMYFFEYNNTHSTSCMVYDAQVYQIADIYQVPALKKHALEKFRASINTGWSMDDFPLAISVVYSTTPSDDRGLRDLAVETSCENIDKLLEQDGFSELLRETADFAADLIPALRSRPTELIQRYRCPACSHQFRAEFSNGSNYCPKCGSRRSDWSNHYIDE